MLTLEGICAGYGKSRILHEVSLRVGGGVVCLLGRNGAGKTTTLRTIMGLTDLVSGDVTFGGFSIVGMPTHRRALAGLNLVPEHRGIFAKLSVRENLEIAVRRGSDWKIDDVLDVFPRLRERLRNGGHQLSGGEQQMLAIARALVGGPKLLLLDEPTEGLAPVIVDEIVRVIGVVSDRGLPILLVEQSLDTCFRVGSEAYILEDGRVVYHGTMADFRQRTDLQGLYLSVAH
jgi:branched-chain amino acid transport system ATP-binding protein